MGNYHARIMSHQYQAEIVLHFISFVTINLG